MASELVKKIGLIVEDDSDVAVFSEIFEKYTHHSNFAIKKFVGRGCSKIRQKCGAWTDNLSVKGCSHIFIVHDLDDFKLLELRELILRKLAVHQQEICTVIVPVVEIEAWLLSYGPALRNVLRLDAEPRIPGEPETIKDPKKFIDDLSKRNSGLRYLNTLHNKNIAKETPLENLRDRPSFKVFDDAVKDLFGLP